MDSKHYYIITDKKSKYNYGKILLLRCFKVYKTIDETIEYITNDSLIYVVEIIESIYIRIIDNYPIWYLLTRIKCINQYSNKQLKQLFITRKVKLLKLIFNRSDTHSIVSSKLLIYMYKYDVNLFDEIEQRIYNNIFKYYMI